MYKQKCKSNQASSGLWYNHPQFKQYCQYYDDMKKWFQVYKLSLSDLNANQSNIAWANGCDQYTDTFEDYTSNSQRENDSVWSWRNQTAETEVSTCNEFSSPSTYNSDEESFVMEITDEMMAFLETSEKHRQTLKLQREEEAKNSSERFTGKYTTVRNGNTKYKHPTYTGCLQESCLPPRERPGVERTAEMRLLYGKNAAMIHGMETSMQLTFDHNCDLHQPKLWPNIPLKM